MLIQGPNNVLSMGYRSGVVAVRWFGESPEGVSFILETLNRLAAEGKPRHVYLGIADPDSPPPSGRTLKEVTRVLGQVGDLIAHPYVVVAQRGFVAAATRAALSAVTLAIGLHNWKFESDVEKILSRHQAEIGESPEAIMNWLWESGLSPGSSRAPQL